MFKKNMAYGALSIFIIVSLESVGCSSSVFIKEGRIGISERVFASQEDVFSIEVVYSVAGPYN
jgi:hypothetical protein